VVPEVRTVPPVDLVALTAMQRLEKFRNPAAVQMPYITAWVESRTLWGEVVPPGATARFDGELVGDRQRLVAISHDRTVTLRRPEGHAGAELALEGTELTGPRYTREAGVVVVNRTSQPVVVQLTWYLDSDSPQDGSARGVTFGPRLTGRDLLCNQMFRDLFGSETLSAGIARSNSSSASSPPAEAPMPTTIGLADAASLAAAGSTASVATSGLASGAATGSRVDWGSDAGASAAAAAAVSASSLALV
jgi:hypothetical protein